MSKSDGIFIYTSIVYQYHICWESTSIRIGIANVSKRVASFVNVGMQYDVVSIMRWLIKQAN